MMSEELMKLKFDEAIFMKSRMHLIKSVVNPISEYPIKFKMVKISNMKKEFTIVCFDLDKFRKENNHESNNKSLVLYFIAIGTTDGVAKRIAEVTNSDIVEIVPVNEYTSNDLDYNNDDARANEEQNDKDARPKIKNEINIQEYDIIYLGYPIWWGN